MESLNQPSPACPPTEAVWNSFHKHIRSTIERRVDNPEDVDDLTQDVFTRIHRSLDSLRAPGTLTNWLGSVTRNAIIDYYRRRSSAPPLLSLDDATDPELGPTLDLEMPEESSVDELRQRERLFRCIAPMIDLLPEPHRQAFVLVERDGMSQREAAEQLGISLSALKSRVQRARKKVRSLVDQCCLFEFDSRGRVMDCQSRRC